MLSFDIIFFVRGRNDVDVRFIHLRKYSCSSQPSRGRAFANAHIPPMAPTCNAGNRKDADPASKQKFEGSFPVSAMI